MTRAARLYIKIVYTYIKIIVKQSNTRQGIRVKEKSNSDNRLKGFVKSCRELTQAMSAPTDKTISKIVVMPAA